MECFFLQLAQPARLLLKYVDQDFEDVQYEQGDGKAFVLHSYLYILVPVL